MVEPIDTSGIEDPNARFAALVAAAEALGGRLNISLTLGKIVPGGLYHVHPVFGGGNTLAEQFDDMDRILSDPRTGAAIDTGERFNIVEDMSKALERTLKVRAAEYKVALEAFRQAFVSPPGPGLDMEPGAIHMLNLDDPLDRFIETYREVDARAEREERARERAQLDTRQGRDVHRATTEGGYGSVAEIIAAMFDDAPEPGETYVPRGEDEPADEEQADNPE